MHNQDDKLTRSTVDLRTVSSLIIENEPAAVLNFFSGVSVAAAASILRYLMIFSVLNSAPSRHSRLRARQRSAALEALGEEEMSDHCSSSSEEDENNEAVS